MSSTWAGAHSSRADGLARALSIVSEDNYLVYFYIRRSRGSPMIVLIMCWGDSELGTVCVYAKTYPRREAWRS
jgi:hypothetical protein